MIHSNDHLRIPLRRACAVYDTDRLSPASCLTTAAENFGESET
jgi:hypothetical protein